MNLVERAPLFPNRAASVLSMAESWNEYVTQLTLLLWRRKLSLEAEEGSIRQTLLEILNRTSAR
jgi:hypothetical protein